MVRVHVDREMDAATMIKIRRVNVVKMETRTDMVTT